MPRPQNENRLKTPIMILKTVKSRMRKYAKKSDTRSGFESDAQVLERMVKYFEDNNKPENPNGNPTYSG